MLGTNLNDRYLLQEELGRGGMGIVYRAEDTLLQRPVAVKLVSAGVLGTEGRARLLGEARAIASLNHPNIVSVHDVGESLVSSPATSDSAGESGQPPGESVTYIVMELLEGHSLRTSPPASIDETLAITIQICAALTQAHDSGIIHRDLKPENIVVTPGGTVKLTDFGLARRVDDEALPDGEVLAGTVHYMAPELILGRPASPRSDLFALGIVLYELLTGRLPTEADNLTALLSQRLHDPLKPPSSHNPGIPPALDVLVLRLLSKRPDDRPASAAEVSRLLRDWTDGVISVDGVLSSARVFSAAGPVQTSAIQRLAVGRLVGREREFADLVALWQLTLTGKGQVALISGEPGIGKTRLARELAVHAEISGGRSLSVACYAEYERPYGPFVQLIEEVLDQENLLLADLPAAARLAVVTLLPDLAGEDSETVNLSESGSHQNQLFDGLVALFGYLTRHRPLLLVVDDLHWLDSGSALLFQHLTRRAGRRQLMIAGTYREVELLESRPFNDVLDQLTREHLITRLKLPRLSFYQTWELLRALFAADLPMDLANAVFRETEGNPFFVAEVSKSLVESGALVHQDGRWLGPEPGELVIPQAVQVAIQMRLAHLSETALSVLQTAALLGRRFRYDLLLAASGLAEDSLITVLEEAERAQLIVEEESPSLSSPVGRPVTYTFGHALIQSTLLTELSTLRRQRRQREVALALEESFPQLREQLAPMLGRYFAEAGDGTRAVPYLLQTGDAARQVFAYDEALHAYEAALLFQKETADHDATSRTLMNIGLIYHSTFRFDQARRAYDEAFALWTATAAVPAEAQAEPDAVFRMALHAPQTLDPARCADGVSEIYICQLFSGLVELSPQAEILPNVAQSWQVLEDGRRYVFHLRPDARWSDGQPLTAADLVFAWRRALDPANGPSPANFLYDIKGAQAYNEGRAGLEALGLSTNGDHQLVVELEGPATYFLQLLSRAVAMPVPAHAVRRFGLEWSQPDKIVTNGPYRPGAWDAAGQITLEFNPHYTGRRAGNVAQVILEPDPELPKLAYFEDGRLDVLRLISLEAEEADRARLRHPVQYVSLPYLHTSYFAFDVSRPPFDDIRLRQAFAMATDKPALADVALAGKYAPALGSFLPPGMPGSSPLGSPPFDPDQARRLMAEAGFPGGRGFPVVKILAARRPLMTAIREHLNEAWTAVLGVQLEWQELWFADFLKHLAAQVSPIWFSGWAADYPDPDTFMRVCNWRYFTGWHDDQYESLVDRARRVQGEEERLAMYRQAEAVLAEQVPVVPLFYSRHHLLLQPWIKKYPVAPVGTLSMKDILVQRSSNFT